MGRGERDRVERAVAVADLATNPQEEVRMTLRRRAEEARDRAEEARGAGRDGMRGERGALRGISRVDVHGPLGLSTCMSSYVDANGRV